MQFDLLRAFPYPVLRPNIEDYTDGEIQADISFSHNDEDSTIIAEIQFDCSVPELLELISNKSAEYCAVFACRETYTRISAKNSESNYQYTFDAGSLRGEVIVYPYIVAREPIEEFHSEWINQEFGAGPFNFPLGAAMALDEPKMIFIDRDAFKPVSSCFTLVKSDKMKAHEWALSADQDKVQIQVSPYLKDRIDNARNNKVKKAVLLNSIYFGAVMQCLTLLKHSDDVDESRWASIFRQRLTELEIDIDKKDECWVAQQLMKQPVSLLDKYIFEEEG